MKFIPNWRSRLRDFSTIALALVTLLSTTIVSAWAAMPEDWRASIPREWVMYCGVAYLVVGAWGAVGKFVVQSHAEPKE